MTKTCHNRNLPKRGATEMQNLCASHGVLSQSELNVPLNGGPQQADMHGAAGYLNNFANE
jgi:hypothetical protein